MNGVSWGEQCGNSGHFHLSSSALPCTENLCSALSSDSSWLSFINCTSIFKRVDFTFFAPVHLKSDFFFLILGRQISLLPLKHLYASVTAPSFQSPPQPLWPPCSDPWSHLRGEGGADDINSLDLMNLSSSIMWADVWGVGLGGWIS